MVSIWRLSKVYDGVSMRFVRWFDGDTGEFKSRIDILYGYASVYPDWLFVPVHQLALTSVAQDELFL